MPDREDAAAGGGHPSFVRAAPLCMATWSVVSLWISYCGSSGVHRRMWPLYSVSLVCTRVMTPETRPASEFQLTWSPTENLVMIAALRSPVYRVGGRVASRVCRRYRLKLSVTAGAAPQARVRPVSATRSRPASGQHDLDAGVAQALQL